MKLLHNIIMVVIFISTTIIYAQTPPAVQQDLMNFEPGELIVKLKDNVEAGVSYQPNGKAISDFNIGELLNIEDKVTSSKVMFHQKSIEASIANSQRLKAVYAAKAAANPNNGYKPKEPLTMKNVFVVKTTDEQENILQLIQQIKNDPSVEYAEPNYIYSIDDFEVGETIYDETTDNDSEQESSETSDATIDVDDPLYSSQSNITSTNIDDVWEQYTTGDGSQVIAILDTGVDYTHPDLEANIWINTEELNGVEGYDDDGNGYVDDIRGWDFHHQTNTPLDDNMHGTHVAGIAGAVGNNGIGIAGAAWNVKLMPIKILQASGIGDSSTIAQGVEYASSNGATILNMSFGSYAQSLTLKAALENAYATSILVAAAGNNAIQIGPCPICAPMFPAAYNYVLAVEANSTWSNNDSGWDGPTFTRWFVELLNYETVAPGAGIISTIPNGGYTTLNGTSMAAPLVAGALALYKELKPNESKELMFGNIINTGEPYGSLGSTLFDLKAAIEVVPQPDLKILTAEVDDEIEGNIYQNGEPDVGETIHLFPKIKNYWGQADNVKVELKIAGNEFSNEYYNTLITIDDNISEVGFMSAYSTYQQFEDPLVFSVNEDVVHNTQIEFRLIVWDEMQDPVVKDSLDFNLKIKNAVQLQGLVEQDTTLYANVNYLLNNTLVIRGATLTIKPGATITYGYNEVTGTNGDIKFYNNNGVPARMLAMGTKDSIITFQKDTYMSGSIGTQEFINTDGGSNANIDSEGSMLIDTVANVDASYCDFCFFNEIKTYGLSVRNSLVVAANFRGDGFFNKSTVRDRYAYDLIEGNKSFSNIVDFMTNSYAIDDITYYYGYKIIGFTNEIGNNTFNLKTNWYYYIGGTQYQDVRSIGYFVPDGFYQFDGTWLGTGSVSKLEELNYDSFDGFQGVWQYDNPRLIPYEEAPGIVWKVLVNDINSFDDELAMNQNPVGVGTHEFKVYFNKAMDTSIDPQVSYGVTIPYNQKVITETGTWSEDGKIYTVNHEIRIGAADGFNRIRVQDAKDLDNWVIPVEDSRFNMLVQSAGSASAGWYATPGLGKIALTWEAPSAEEIDDALGYNMYRYQVDADGVESDPVKLNETLIVEDTDESTTGVYYTDFDVLEGETYFYKYNILRTSFETTDFSSVVSSTPLTSTLGDSNGDFEVNVLDLVQNVDYIVGNNPEPFIFVAGDVNADEIINILDIVGTVDIIINGDTSSSSSSSSNEINFYPSNPVGDANFTWEGNDLYVESNFDIGGIQLAFNTDFDYILSEELPSIERLDYTQEDSKILMLYSFNNTMIASSKTKILTRLDASQEFDIEQAVVGTTSGAKLNAVLNSGVLSTIDAPFQNKNLQFLNLYPNPAEGLVHLEYYLPNQMDQVVAKVYDLLGRLVHMQVLENREGISKTPMELSRLKTGNYIVLITANKGGSIKNIANKKLIIE